MSNEKVQHRGFQRPRGGHGPLRGVVEKPKNFRKSFVRLMKYLKPYIIPLIVVFALAITGTVLSIIAPKILGKATTKIFQGFLAKKIFPKAKIDLEGILNILIKVGILYGLYALFMYIQQYIMAGISQKVVKRLRTEVMDKLTKLPLKFYDSRTHGEILSRITNDVDLISNTLNQSLTQFVTSLVTIVGVIIMMLTISPLLTLVTVGILPLSILIISFIVKRSQKYFKMQQMSIGKVNGHVEEMFAGLVVVKAYNREEESIEKFEKHNNNLYNAAWRAQFISGITMPLMRFVSNLGYVIVAVVGGIMVTKRTIELGDVQAFIQYSNQFSQPIAQVANIMNMIQSTIAAAERVFEILDEEEELPDPEDAIEIQEVKGNVKFENVYFSYRTDKKLIEDLNIEVKSGQTVAIVGPTGAGKTTLVNLLMRFYEIQGGKITIDGIDIRRIKRENLRKIFGMVLQDTWLFNGTIEENIAYGKENASREEVIEAAKRAHAHHFIMALPGGYDAVINEEASNISQGEKQLITIARAFIADPDILILDEATSNVDTLTERYIQKAMKNLMHSRTNFVIAHRLSTIVDADIILVMNEGQIIEKGTHKELMEKNGFYAELYKSQFLGAYV
ncbi:ABC transporter ATP-binding protein [Thermosipho atlanticus]|uniref:ATP-binding cassette, subfamily B n=1 Tax=Thermosipho atlanticus DSM 15807 TaxID=1123380 RepID=A0A1M5S0J5_9BACT|nr:ABC transporter ATP-binding protein [Thermosipho atlanticus]SHH31986.1 ATP-binding cassette, subfamily B [Thermosipho atlanticus DSM 15807]